MVAAAVLMGVAAAVTVADIAADPAAYDGQRVRLEAELVLTVDASLILGAEGGVICPVSWARSPVPVLHQGAEAIITGTVVDRTGIDPRSGFSRPIAAAPKSLKWVRSR